MKPGKSYSPTVLAIVGGGSPKKGPPSDEAMMDEGDEDAGLTAIGKAFREALEKKDDAAIGRSIKDAIEYCGPDSYAEESEEK